MRYKVYQNGQLCKVMAKKNNSSMRYKVCMLKGSFKEIYDFTVLTEEDVSNGYIIYTVTANNQRSIDKLYDLEPYIANYKRHHNKKRVRGSGRYSRDRVVKPLFHPYLTRYESSNNFFQTRNISESSREYLFSLDGADSRLLDESFNSSEHGQSNDLVQAICFLLVMRDNEWDWRAIAHSKITYVLFPGVRLGTYGRPSLSTEQIFKESHPAYNR